MRGQGAEEITWWRIAHSPDTTAEGRAGQESSGGRGSAWIGPSKNWAAHLSWSFSSLPVALPIRPEKERKI